MSLKKLVRWLRNNADIDYLYKSTQEQNKVRDADVNTINIPPYSILILYLPGNYIGNDGFTTGYTYSSGNGLPYLIYLPNLSTYNVLAHEVGHVLNYSNKNGYKDDPDPDIEYGPDDSEEDK